ncbi:hypothetical protein AURDEDRAFT_151990, partial [Auricularia subglabra TFB-10046 SS5]
MSSHEPGIWDATTPPMAVTIHCESAEDCQTMHACLDAYPELRFLVRSISMAPYLAAFSSMSPDGVLSLAARCPHLRHLHFVASQDASLPSADVAPFLGASSFKELVGLDIGSSDDSSMSGPKDSFLAGFFALTPNLESLTIRAPWKMSISRPFSFPISVSSLYIRGSDQPSPTVVRIISSSSSTLRRFRLDLTTATDGTSQDSALRALRDVRPAIRHLELVCTPGRDAHCLTLKLGTMFGTLAQLRHLTLVLRTMRECAILEQSLNFLPCPLNSLRLDLRIARDTWFAIYWQSLVDAVSRSYALRALRQLEITKGRVFRGTRCLLLQLDWNHLDRVAFTLSMLCLNCQKGSLSDGSTSINAPPASFQHYTLKCFSRLNGALASETKKAFQDARLAISPFILVPVPSDGSWNGTTIFRLHESGTAALPSTAAYTPVQRPWGPGNVIATRTQLSQRLRVLIGAVLGTVVVVVALFALWYAIYRNRRDKKAEREYEAQMAQAQQRAVSRPRARRQQRPGASQSNRATVGSTDQVNVDKPRVLLQDPPSGA